MSTQTPNDRTVDDLAQPRLQAMARQKVQAALAGLSEVKSPAEPAPQGEQDPVVLDAVERMQTHLSQLVAADQWGRPLTWAQLARVVIGPLADRVRDADTAGVLIEALTLTHPEQPHLVEHHADHLKRRLLPLEGGGQRYVFEAESKKPVDVPTEELAESQPETPAPRDHIVDEVHLAEERLLAALEHRYPEPQPRPHAERAVQGVGWPVH